MGRLCRPQKHISDRKCARRARAAGCNLLGRKRPAGLFWPEKNAPDFFKSGALNSLQRGTTLVQPPVARTALKASNKAAAGNEARRSALLRGSGEKLGDQLSTAGTAHRFAPSTGSLRGYPLSLFPSSHLLVKYCSGSGPFCQEEICPEGEESAVRQKIARLFPAGAA